VAMRAGRMVMGSIVMRGPRGIVRCGVHSEERAARFASFVARNLRPDFLAARVASSCSRRSGPRADSPPSSLATCARTSSQPASRAPAVGEAARAS